MNSKAKNHYESHGYHIVAEPVLAPGVVQAVRDGMERVMAGDYDTSRPPEPSTWNLGDDPQSLVKIEQPQKANQAIAALIGSSPLGEWAAAVTGAEMVQPWWVQLLGKPPTSVDQKPRTNIGWHRDWPYWKSAWKEGSEVFTVWVALRDVLRIPGR